MLTILRCSVKRSLGRAFSSTSAAKENLDPLQEASLKETCFLVDENDKIIGRGTKMECHRVQKGGEIPLHRAFSVFLFNKKGDLLLQKRSSNKVSNF